MTMNQFALEQQEEARKRCHRDVISQPYPSDGRLYCNATWDTWGCWNYTLAGTWAKTKCPAFISGYDPALDAYKNCTIHGTWWLNPENKPWANYTSCVNLDQLKRDRMVVELFISGYSVSIIALVISLLIFSCFRQLQCDRITIHKHLFTSYICTGLAWILLYTLAAMDPDVLNQNPAWCQVLHVFAQYFTTCNFFWMFCEGLYLHTLIVVAFTNGKKVLNCCIAIGWGVPMVSTAIYTTARALSKGGATECWLPESNYTWIIVVPILITLFINILFICNIMRVLISKLRHSTADHRNTKYRIFYIMKSTSFHPKRKAVRAIIILIPLLGLQFILFPFRPEKDAGRFLFIYRMLSATVTSFQGFFVALIFCFLNGEVITLLARKWKQRRMSGGHFVASQSEFTNRTRIDHTASPGKLAFAVFKDRSRSPIYKGNGRNNHNKQEVLPLKAHGSPEESTVTP